MDVLRVRLDNLRAELKDYFAKHVNSCEPGDQIQVLHLMLNNNGRGVIAYTFNGLLTWSVQVSQELEDVKLHCFLSINSILRHIQHLSIDWLLFLGILWTTAGASRVRRGIIRRMPRISCAIVISCVNNISIFSNCFVVLLISSFNDSILLVDLGYRELDGVHSLGSLNVA